VRRMCEADAAWHRSHVAALQRLAGELLGAASPAAIGELVVTTANVVEVPADVHPGLHVGLRAVVGDRA